MPHIHWDSRQNKLEIPRDKAEVNKRGIRENDGPAHDPDTMVVPPTPKPTRKDEVLVRVPPTIASRRKDAALKEVLQPRRLSNHPDESDPTIEEKRRFQKGLGLWDPLTRT